jgi:hypothetical protein
VKKYTFTCLLLCLTLLSSIQLLSQEQVVKTRIYDQQFDPQEHPDFSRKFVKPPGWGTFNNQVQFITLRSLEGDFKQKINDYTIKYDLGKVIWPSYSTLYLSNIDSIVQEIKERKLFLFDLWGYVPGSGPGGYWQQFYPPSSVLNKFESVLGDHWLGMDNGEQDGRYVGGFAKQLFPSGANNQEQYFNFQNHFEALCNELGNKMATLVSLNFGHYLLKEGVYTFIGAETAQGLPNAQVYYSFIRGASKQYGVPWFGNVSVWNRWGYKSYTVDEKDNGGPTKGTSLSLLKRLLYSQIFYNSMMVGFESGFMNGDKLGSIGEIQQHANKWSQNFGQPGNMITQVALMLDFYSGWSFPRHLYSKEIYKVWGNLPYQQGDYFVNNVLNIFYPGYQNSSYFHNETGFNVATPYGDVLDCILTDCPLWLLKQYPILVVAGNVNTDQELKDKLEDYVSTGGHLVITSGVLTRFEEGLCGLSAAGNEYFKAGQSVKVGDSYINENFDFSMAELHFPGEADVLAECNKKPLAVSSKSGLGNITVLAADYGISKSPANQPIKSEIDKELPNPFPILNHVSVILNEIFKSQSLFNVGEDLSYIVTRKSKGIYNLLICNNNWEEKPLNIKSGVCKVLSVSESKLNVDEMKAIGYKPDGFEKYEPGRNTSETIAGGDVRVFTVKTDENIELIPVEKPELKIQNRFLRLNEPTQIKKEILSRPTFFQHYSGVVVDWKYLNKRSVESIKNESGWIDRQKLNLIVDFTSGINLFPDLRLINNDSIAFNKSITTIKSVIDKSHLLGVHDLILSPHRKVENNFSAQQFLHSFSSTLKEIANYAKEKDVRVHLRLSEYKSFSPDQIIELMTNVGSDNLFIAPGLPWLSSNGSLKMLSDNQLDSKIRMIFLSSSEKDLYGQLFNENAPLYKNYNIQEVHGLVERFPGAFWIFDGNYELWDEEYKDVKVFNNIIQEPLPKLTK